MPDPSHATTSHAAFARAARLLADAVDRGVMSAASLGVVTPGGARSTTHCGNTRAWRRAGSPDGPLVADPGDPVDARSRYDLASLTKPIATSTLVARLLSDERSGWRLDTPLVRVLPAATQRPIGRATIGALLSHTAGLPGWLDFFTATNHLTDPRARAARALELVLTTPLDSTIGTVAVYSDLGFILLGAAVEQALRSRLDDAFDSLVARPAGLSTLAFRRISRDLGAQTHPICATEIWPPRCPDGGALIGVVHDDNCAALDGVAGHAGLFGTLDDVLTWAESWLGLLAGHDAPTLGITAAIARQLVAHQGAPDTTWRAAFDTPSPGASSAGASASPSAVGHLGFTGTSVWLDPRRGAVVMLTNRVHPSREPHGPIKALRPAVHDAAWSALD